MDLETMYKGIAFSPTAVITANISATDTMIPVNDVDAFPDAPNIATIGVDAGAETIIYNDKTTSMLTGCTRGVEGVAKDWEQGTVLGRNFTAKDHRDIVENIQALSEEKLDATFKVEVTNSDEIAIAGKALDATQNNKEINGSLAYEINKINSNQKIRHYAFLSDLGLADAEFEGLTQVQGFDLLIENMGYNSCLEMRLDSGANNFRYSIIDNATFSQFSTGVLRVEVVSHLRYHCTLMKEEQACERWGCSGYPNFTTGWTKLTTQTKVEITSSMLKNEWALKTDYGNNIAKTGDKISVVLAVSGGILTGNTIVCEGLPTIAKDMLLQVQSNTGQMYMAVYKTNGSIVLLNTLTSATFYYIHN